MDLIMRPPKKFAAVPLILCSLLGCTSVPTCSNALHSTQYASAVNQYGYAAIAQGNSRCSWSGSYNNQDEANTAALKNCFDATKSHCDLYATGMALTDWGRQREQESQQAFESDVTGILAVGNQLAFAKAAGAQQAAAYKQIEVSQQQQALVQQQQLALQRQQAAAAQQQLATAQQQSYALMIEQQQLAAQQQAARTASQQTQLAQQRPPGVTTVATATPTQAQYHPSFSDQGLVQQDPSATIDGVPGSVSDFIVRVTNTGDVLLSCAANASALIANATGTGGSCIGVPVDKCAAGQQFNTANTAPVYPGQSADVILIRYYLKNGTYQVSCNSTP